MPTSPPALLLLTLGSLALRAPAAPAASVPPAGWLRDLWATQGFLEGTEHAGSGGGQWPANISFTRILDELVPPASYNKYVVNIGANDGSRHDPAFPLLVERGFGGVHIEGDPAFKKRLYANLKPFNGSGNVHVSWGFASAAKIGERLRRYACPAEPDAFKIDCDGLDAALLEGVLLSGIRPKAVVVEVNPDIPPPLRLAQLDHPDFTFEFVRKHMRGWLGASANALYTLLAEHGYALIGFELGTREHLICSGGGKRGGSKMCQRKNTCTHCENNMWFLRADLLRAAGIEPPTWPQFVHAFWRQTFAFNTFAKNREQVFKQQRVTHQGHFTAEDEAQPYTPECYSLSDHQYAAAHLPGDPDVVVKPPCPLQTLRSQVEQLQGATAAAGGGGGGGWRDWAKLSLKLARTMHADAAAAFAVSTANSIKAPACPRPGEACPHNASSHVHARGAAHQGRSR